MMIYYNHGLAILIFLWALFSSNSNAVITTTISITKPNGAPKNFSIESISSSTVTSSQTSTGNPQDVTEITSENVKSTEARNLNTTKKANEFGTTEKLSETSKTSAPEADYIEPTSSKSRKKSATASYDYSRRSRHSGSSVSGGGITKTMVDYLIRVIGMTTLINWINWAIQNFANIMPTLLNIFQSKDKIGQNITKQPIYATTMVVQPRQSGLVANPGAVAPKNGGWTDPVLQAALNTDPNAKFIPVSIQRSYNKIGRPMDKIREKETSYVQVQLH